MKTAVVLSGCGVMDGSEIHEAVLTLLHLDLVGSDVQCIAPNENQLHVVDHVSQKICTSETRNILHESARIARGAIYDMGSVRAADIDALVFPGGFGAAKNLCAFALDGTACRVHPQAERLISEMLEAQKPIGALCIAPVLVARVLGGRGHKVKVTIGNDPGVAEQINQMGAVHINCPVNEAVIDETFRVVTSPAYMLAQSIRDVYASAGALVRGILRLAKK